MNEGQQQQQQLLQIQTQQHTLNHTHTHTLETISLFSALLAELFVCRFYFLYAALSFIFYSTSKPPPTPFGKVASNVRAA